MTIVLKCFLKLYLSSQNSDIPFHYKFAVSNTTEGTQNYMNCYTCKPALVNSRKFQSKVSS